jgi:hypothetical protein
MVDPSPTLLINPLFRASLPWSLVEYEKNINQFWMISI